MGSFLNLGQTVEKHEEEHILTVEGHQEERQRVMRQKRVPDLKLEIDIISVIEMIPCDMCNN